MTYGIIQQFLSIKDSAIQEYINQFDDYNEAEELIQIFHNNEHWAKELKHITLYISSNDSFVDNDDLDIRDEEEEEEFKYLKEISKKPWLSRTNRSNCFGFELKGIRYSLWIILPLILVLVLYTKKNKMASFFRYLKGSFRKNGKYV